MRRDARAGIGEAGCGRDARRNRRQNTKAPSTKLHEEAISWHGRSTPFRNDAPCYQAVLTVTHDLVQNRQLAALT